MTDLQNRLRVYLGFSDEQLAKGLLGVPDSEPDLLDILAGWANAALGDYTVITAQGKWNGSEEIALIIEHITPAIDYSALREQLTDLKRRTGLKSILWTVDQVITGMA